MIGIFADRYLRFALVNVVTILTRTEKIRGIICVKQPAKLRTKLREILIDRAIGAVSYKMAKSYPHASKMLQWIRVCISTSPSFMHTRMHLFNIRVCSLCLFNKFRKFRSHVGRQFRRGLPTYPVNGADGDCWKLSRRMFPINAIK